MPSIEDIEEACQAFKEGPLKDYIDSFRKFADFWDGMNNYDHYGWKMFGQHPNEEDLIFRKLTGIDEFFDRGKIRGRSQTTFTRFVLFLTTYPLRLHFLWYKSLQSRFI